MVQRRGTPHPPYRMAQSQSPRVTIPSTPPLPEMARRPRPFSSIPRGNYGQLPSSSSLPMPGPRSRPSSAAVSRASVYSPQLPPHPERSRLSLRPSALRASSTSRDAQSEGNIDGQGQADDHLSVDNADALNEVILALDMKQNGNLGCAYYIASEEALFLMEDVSMATVEIVETVLLHAKPTTIMAPPRVPQEVHDKLQRGAHDEGGSVQNGVQGAYILRTLKSVDFRYDAGVDKLLGVQSQVADFQNMRYDLADAGRLYQDDVGDQHEYSQEVRMRLGTIINLESRLAIGCAGAVLGDLRRRRTTQYLPNDPDALVAFSVKSIAMFTLFDSMFVNADTMISLQIIQPEYHPNSQMRGPDKSSMGAKENLSIYGLFHFLACTPQGRHKLRRTFMRPSIDIDLIQTRQKTLAFFLRPGNAETVMQLGKDLRQVKNMRSTIAFLEKGVDSPGRKVSVRNGVWASLQRFALYALRIRDALAQMTAAETIPIIVRVLESVRSGPLVDIGESISRTIDFEQSSGEERTAVKRGIDANLDEMKRQYDGMEHLLTEVGEKMRGDIPEWAQHYICNCVFLPQLGFLTVVSLNQQTGKPNYEGEGLNDIWEQMFVTDGEVYCKNQRMKAMDEQCGDAYCMIIDREIEILYELSVLILDHQDAIREASDIIGELDSLLAMAVGSGKYGWVAPRIVHENVLQIEGGRHPLQELVVPSFISNDCELSGGNGEEQESDPFDQGPPAPSSGDLPSTMILTGPNHSGKSIYLKQTALIVYLAHLGCFVPADRALIGITDRILTRIATRESVTRQESAFAIDLRQAAFAMNFATRRSLVLIDEFGKGTNSQDGAGLLTALLCHFTGLGPERPKVLAATHFHEIFENGFLTESMELAFAHMDVRIDFDADASENQVTYLFKLAPGRSISSFGSRCAAMNGIDEAVVERAEAIIMLLARNEDLEAACSKLSDTETSKLEMAEGVARAFLEQEIEAAQSRGRMQRTGGRYRAMLEQILRAESSTSTST
ncbi:p-loop containing nucleoside triphosphate hydrolase [Apiospora kogelbergensis]|uniref:p-loop containing nucleoside triphosphate hydrolase n=1 Tax=Apiospora kogelbergensis TaxID=1337665 RepID=UPI00312ECCE5